MPSNRSANHRRQDARQSEQPYGAIRNANPCREVPAGSVDAHVHVFEPGRFPFSARVSYRPTPGECGTAADLARLLDSHGVDRVVVVNPTSGYGDDNRCMLAALAQLGPRARGIARVPPRVAARTLANLRGAGVAGVRLDLVAQGPAVLQGREFPRFLTRLADLDLLLQIQCEGDQFAAVAPHLERVPVRCVVDHLGRPDPRQGLDQPGFRALLGSAEHGRVAVKLSGLPRCSNLPAPHADLDPFVAALMRAFTPRALVWGSDWPFLRSASRIDYAPNLALLARQVPRATDRRAVLATTPARWFGF